MLLQTIDLTKDYGHYRALDRLNLTVKPGEIFGLLGPNGSGKSTALRLLLGFLRPTSGTATIGGHDCWRDGVKARQQVAYLPGELRLYESMTGRELIAFLSKLRNVPSGNGVPGATAIETLARAFDIDIARPIANLSSGMKRKVALLQVLIPHAPLLILDEPTNTLDPTMRDELLEQLLRARELGQAVLFSSHVLAEVERVCDRVGILQQGRLVHVQEMSALREIRLIRARFAAPVAAPESLPGVRRCEPSDGGHDLLIEHDGPLPGLLGWLAEHQVQELNIEPFGLEEIYERYHGNRQ